MLLAEQLKKKMAQQRNGSTAEQSNPTEQTEEDEEARLQKRLFKRDKYARNVALNLLFDTDSEESECAVADEKELEVEYRKKILAPKSEHDCKTLEDLKRFLAEQEREAIQADEAEKFKANKKALKKAFKRA